ncbi:hypothetical protein [Formosa sp. A9]|uniref:hypothetical protein n=1 Tax=Formosa sp. A9 TaxID=3442641 RepID=UPI003EBC15F4
MNTKINIRIDHSSKLSLERYAEDQQETLSVYLRNVLVEHIYKVRTDPSINNSEPLRGVRAVYVKPFEETFGFTFLITWLFYKHLNPNNNDSIEFMWVIRDRLESVMEESNLTESLKDEFLKILDNVTNYLEEPNDNVNQLKFQVQGNEFSFDYQKLAKEILAIKH